MRVWKVRRDERRTGKRKRKERKSKTKSNSGENRRKDKKKRGKRKQIKERKKTGKINLRSAGTGPFTYTVHCTSSLIVSICIFSPSPQPIIYAAVLHTREMNR